MVEIPYSVKLSVVFTAGNPGPILCNRLKSIMFQLHKTVPPIIINRSNIHIFTNITTITMIGFVLFTYTYLYILIATHYLFL